MTQKKDDTAFDELQKKIKAQEELNEKELETAEDQIAQQDEKDAKIEELTRVAKQAAADLANFRRRSEEEKKQFVQYANANLILELLQVVDTFDRSLKAMPEDLKNNDWALGIQGIDRQLHGILEKQGLKKIQAVGEKFNVTMHEPMMTGPGEKDMILEELEAGFMLGERVIRPAKVKIGNGESAAE